MMKRVPVLPGCRLLGRAADRIQCSSSACFACGFHFTKPEMEVLQNQKIEDDKTWLCPRCAKKNILYYHTTTRLEDLEAAFAKVFKHKVFRRLYKKVTQHGSLESLRYKIESCEFIWSGHAWDELDKIFQHLPLINRPLAEICKEQLWLETFTTCKPGYEKVKKNPSG